MSFADVTREIRALARADAGTALLRAGEEVAALLLGGAAAEAPGRGTHAVDGLVVAERGEGGHRLTGRLTLPVWPAASGTPGPDTGGGVAADREPPTWIAVPAELFARRRGEPPAGAVRLDLTGPGVSVLVHEESFGLAGTASAEVVLEAVPLPPERVTADGASDAIVRGVDDLLVTAAGAGLVDGFLAAAREFAVSTARPWFESGVATASADPHLVGIFGQAHAVVRAAGELLDDAALAADRAVAADADPAAPAELAAHVARASRYLHHRLTPQLTAVLSTLGGSATSGRYGFDRWWRDLRALRGPRVGRPAVPLAPVLTLTPDLEPAERVPGPIAASAAGTEGGRP